MIILRSRELFSFFIAAALTMTALATDPTLDAAFTATISPGITPDGYPTWNNGTGAVNAVALQSDGKIIVGGNISRYQAPPAGSAETSLKRLNADGTFDSGFNAFASTLADTQGDTEVNKILVTAGDKMYVGGVFQSYQSTSRSGIMRLNADGSLDAGFNLGGVSNTVSFGTRYVLAIAEQADGKVLVGGAFNRLTSGSVFVAANLVRVDSNGARDTTFCDNVNVSLGNSIGVHDLAVLPDGKILVAGAANKPGGGGIPLLVRLNADGTLDPTFTANWALEYGDIDELLVLPDGRILIGGDFTFAGTTANMQFACLNASGSVNTAFMSNVGSGPNGWAGGELALQPDGTILVGGVFYQWNGQPRASIARLNADGTLDAGLAVPPYTQVQGQYLTHFYSFAVQPDGKIVVGGWFDRITDTAVLSYNLARITNEYAPGQPGTLRMVSATRSTAENAGSVDLSVSRFTGLTGAVGISYSVTAGSAVEGTDYTAVSGTLNWADAEGGLKTITVPILQDTAQDGARTFTVTLSTPTGGAFLPGGGTSTLVTILDDDALPSITLNPQAVSLEQGASFTLRTAFDSVLSATVKWQLDTGSGFNDIPGATSTVYTVTNASAASHAGTYRAVVTNANGVTNSGTAAVSISIPAGSIVNAFAPPADTPIVLAANALSMDTTGRFLIASNSQLRRLNADGTLESTTTFGINVSTINAVLSLPDGRTLVAGNLGTITHVPSGGTSTVNTRIFRLNDDATSTIDTTWSVSTNGIVTALALGASGKFYVGSGAAPTSTNGIQRFNADGTTDASWTPVVNTLAAGTGATVVLIRELADGKVLISHRHGPTSGGTYRLTRVTSTGAIDTTFGTNGSIDFGTSNWVNGLDVLPDGRLAVSARFNPNFFTTGQQYLALLNANGTLDTTFQFATGVLNGNPNGVIYRDGRLFVFGAFTTVNGSPQGGVARVNLDGSIDSSFSAGVGVAGGAASVNAARYTAAGEIFIAGGFTSYKGVARNYTALLVGNPQIGTLGFAPPRVNTLEEAATLTLTLKRYGDSTQAASIDWATADGTATAGVDYVVANGTATWAAGDSADKTIPLTKLNNAAIHANRVFTVALSNPSGPVGAGAPATITLIDDDTPVTINTQPVASTALYETQALNLSVAATSPSALSYQWYLNGVAISGATSATYNVPASLVANGGVYHVQLTNASGSYSSTPSLVAVRPQPGRPAAGQATSGRPVFPSAPIGIVAANDGYVYVGGSFTANAVGNVPQAYLIRVKPDGSTDTSYSYTPGSNITAMALQSDGKILIAGTFTDRVRRLNADGTLDAAFTTALGSSIPAVQINDFAFDSLGRIYLGGASYLARLSSAGAIDSGYTPAVNNTVNALAIQQDDKLIVAGLYTSLAGSAASRLGRLNTDGTRDAAYTGTLGGTTTPNDLLVLADGRVLLAMGGSSTLAELSNTGAQISNIASTNQVYQIAQAPGGKILATRTSTTGTDRVFRLSGTNPFPVPGSNDMDSTFSIGTGPDADARALTVAPDGSVWITGLFSSVNSVATSGVARLNGDPLTPGIVTQPATTGVSPGETAYLGVGTFGSGLTFQWLKNGSPLNNGGNVSGATSAVLTLSGVTTADDANYTVEVTGGSTTLTSAVAHVYVLGAPVVHAPPAATTIYAGQNAALNAQVYALTPATYVWKRDGVTVTDGGRISGATTATLSFTGALMGDTGSYTLTVTNGQGTVTTTPVFLLVKPIPHERVPALGNLAASGQVTAFHAQPDGRMLVAGTFQHNFTGGAGGTSNTTTSLALVKPDGSYDTNPSVLANGSINALARQNDGKWIIGGAFTTINGAARSRVARLNADFTLDPSLDTGTGPNSAVNALGIDHATGKIYVGGLFASWNGLNGAGKNYLVRLNSDGTLDTTFTLSVSQTVTRILPVSGGDFLFTGTSMSVQRITSAGTAVGGFSGPFGSGLDLAFTPDGTQFYVAWSGSPYLRRYSTTTGAEDTTFTHTLNNSVSNVAVQADGKLVINGGFSLPTTSPLRLLPNGTVDPTFTKSAALGATVTAITIQPSGRIWLGGTFSQTYGPATASRLLVLNGDLPALAFEAHPVTAQVEGGQTATFTASVAATSPVTWQWFKGSTPLSNGGRVSGATSATLSIANVIPGDEGLYHVEATSAVSGTLVSLDAELIFLDAPELLVAPAGGNSEVGISRTLTVKARGAAPLSYQWFKGTASSAIADISGATSASYTLATPTLADTAYYGVRITNSLGMVTTTPVLVRFETYGAAVNQNAAAFNNPVNAIIPNVDGSVDFGGAFNSVTPVGGFATSRGRITRILANGTIESNATIPGANTAVTMMHRDSSNRLVLTGTTITNITYNPSPSHARVNFARLDYAGAIDTTYIGPFTNSNNLIYAMTSESDGRVYIGGQFSSSLPTVGQYLARLDATTGAVDTSFATASGLTTVRALHLRTDGKLLVGHNGGVWLLNSDGTRDLTFTGSTTGALAFLPLANGDVIVATASTLYKLNSAGGTVAGWPTATINYGNSSSILLQPLTNGDICISGTFNTFNSAIAGHIAFVNADGTVDTSYAIGSGFNNAVNAIALDGQGRLHLGGYFTTYKGATATRYVILNAAGNTPTDPGAPADALNTFLANAGVPGGQQRPAR
ncbi:MAG: hypothetical protein IPK32_13365 [Verrucomicrobiaceae bacterium]|nr:hypothetical protein [Verrucomicrobiaceae bacterium]